MGVFPLTAPNPPPQVAMIEMISTIIEIPSKGISNKYMTSLILFEAIYHVIQSTYDDYTIDDNLLVASEPYSLPYWLDSPLPYLYYLLHIFPSDESIMYVMFLNESLWGDHHHRYSFLQNSQWVEDNFVSFVSSDIFTFLIIMSLCKTMSLSGT